MLTFCLQPFYQRKLVERGLLGIPVDRANRLSDALNALLSVSGYHHGRHPSPDQRLNHVMRFISDAIGKLVFRDQLPIDPPVHFRPRRDFLIERGWLIAACDGPIRHEVIGAHHGCAANPNPLATDRAQYTLARHRLNRTCCLKVIGI